MFRGKSETPQSLVEQELRLRSGESPLEQNSFFKSQQDTIKSGLEASFCKEF
ncbi:hypothetical protein LSS_21815 [Leptospira santarosai serovar Shermani str. LT 821]|uniref:Uncharacterized protein n=1 Tax=Leptospira santarosai serovar Shermani str. LT 821 TaxID=758847 RepID=A0A097ESK4_9LEPT|nr:hypothetical protein LSS_21805 [Leptospira santarosai serovar Shermani str. LT 821]AIT10917.1 hypothetical protein LSS_21810 [Leptospira santarosai serovar Shermani str. LT 821]AIT10918.1 hypothetical protein LSS_21815 [Leptospira santarosai serovar Shermani str. LT 821]